MRLSEDQIKQAIFHPEPDIRDRAAHYFAHASVPDPSIMPLVMQAVEKYDKHHAYQMIGSACDLPQSAASIAWVLGELNDDQSKQYENYIYNLCRLLLAADPTVLLPHESALFAARHFPAVLHEQLRSRLRIATWAFATCWQKLEEFCETNKDETEPAKVDLTYASQIVEALGRFGAASEAKVLAILSERKLDTRGQPLYWLGPFAVQVAGKARLEAAIPALIRILNADLGDLDNEECAAALAEIGTPAVLTAVAAVYPEAAHHFRLYATQPLERIHSDLAVETSLQLLAREQDLDIQMYLAEALLQQFAEEGITAAVRLLRGRDLDFQTHGLRNLLLQTSIIMQATFPERDAWLAEEAAEKAAHARRVKELADDPQGMMLYALEKIVGKQAAVSPPPPPKPAMLAPRPLLPSKPSVKKKVGRNEPCPCRSGKKFKNCCMR